jgi:EmrB/QacA subfamily drug resistance transporter
VASAGYVLFGFNSTATNLAFGSIADDFATASESTVSLVASGFFIASAAFLPVGGRLADRVGRRRVFNVGLVGFIVSALASALAPTVEILIAARVAQAVAGALVIPSSLAVVLPEFPAARRPSAVATWAAAGPLSAALAPSTAALLLEATSWRWVYFLTAPAAALVLVGSTLMVTESRGDDDSEDRLDILGSGLAVASVALLVLGIGQGTDWGWTDGRTIAVIVGALTIGGIFVIRSSRHPAPLVNLSLFRIPEIAIANLANFFMSLTSLSVWLIWPLFLDRVWGYSIGRVGLAITIGPICAGPAALLGGRLADRYGQRWLMVIGSAICTVAVTWSVFSFSAEPNYLIALMPTVAGFGLGWGISNPSMNSWALAHGPSAFYGEINASFNTIRNLAAAIGTAVGIAIIGAADRPDPVGAYRSANAFFAIAVGLSCLTLVVGTMGRGSSGRTRSWPARAGLQGRRRRRPSGLPRS